MGSSEPWQNAMEALTGQRSVSAKPLLEYFEPLRLWLERENARNDESIGWSVDAPSTNPGESLVNNRLTVWFALMLAFSSNCWLQKAND